MVNDQQIGKLEQLNQALYLFNHRGYFDSFHTFGNKREEGGVRFTLWAPNAQEIAIIGDVNDWREDHLLEKIGIRELGLVLSQMQKKGIVINTKLFKRME